MPFNCSPVVGDKNYVKALLTDECSICVIKVNDRWPKLFNRGGVRKQLMLWITFYTARNALSGLYIDRLLSEIDSFLPLMY